ncbi:HD domain-containing protein [Radiobacillus sp. PE A8.2]|uniref:HD domain-containing protein n=1 Tax=Radiobacillus sp. PE A8.2 TaxID=3380349 RepID=UPI00388E391B
MRNVTLEEIFVHPIAQKYLGRSGIAHAVAVAEHAYKIAIDSDVCPDLATKAALLHDIGHYNWYRDGKWDYQLYKENDIHPIKGAARAHKLLVRLGEEPQAAKAIALAILLHTDSYLPDGNLHLNPLQRIVSLADEADEQPGGAHHYRSIEHTTALEKIKKLDHVIELELIQQNNKEQMS